MAFATRCCFLLLLLPLASYADSVKSNPLSVQYRDGKFEDFVNEVHRLFPTNRPSSWADAKSWKPIGTRFAAAYDHSGKLIAIYDLSYPAAFGAISLGKIGNPKITGDYLVQLWKDAKKNEAALSSDQVKAIEEMGQEPETALGQLAPAWQSLPGKSFRLTDLDPAQLKLNPGVFSGLRQLFQLVLDDAASIQALSDDEILAAFHFVHASDGSYEILWEDPRTAPSNLANLRPRKLLDLQSPQEGLYENMVFDTAIFGLGEATDFIPIPLVEALISTAISRLGRYYDMTRVEHLEMLRELMIETSEGSLIDPELTSMSAGNLSTLRNALIWDRVSPLSFWDWLFTQPEESWNQDEKKAEVCESSSTAWYATHNDTVENLNSRFSIVTNPGTTDPGNEKTLDLDALCGGAGPAVSINYRSPKTTAASREWVEAEGTAFEFATYLIPTGGFFVREAYRLLVQDSVDMVQYWESRLIQHLEVRPDASDWKNELGILQRQRTNPFEIDRSQMEKLISERRATIGL